MVKRKRRLRARVCVVRVVRFCDPGLANVFSTDHIAPADPTAGPNRLTLHVPFNDTRLSLGQGHAPYKTDTGIVGTTEEHIGWEVKVGGGVADPPAGGGEQGGGDQQGGGQHGGGGH